MRLLIGLLFVCSTAFAALTDVDRAEITPKNILVNSGFESGRGSWVASGGTAVAVTSGSNLLVGRGSVTWDSSSASQTFCSSLVPVPNGLKGRNGLARVLAQVPTGAATHNVVVNDGTSDLATVAITSSTTPQTSSLNFIFPSSGSVRLCLRSVSSDEPLIALDDMYVGAADNLTNVSQAEFVGSVRYAVTTNCVWSTTSSSYANFAADTDCPTATVAGQASAPATKIPAITFASLPPGEYLFIANGYFVSANAGTAANMAWQFSDGTNAFGNGSSSNLVSAGSAITGRVQYTTVQSNVTINLQAKTSSAANAASIFNDSSAYANHFDIVVYRYPLASQTLFNADTVNWKLDLNINGANIDLGSANQTAYIAPNNANLTMTINTSKGSAQAGISCSGANDNTVGSTTCSVGNEEPGFVANFPRAGLVEVCTQFSHGMSNSASSTVLATFQNVRTANGSQTIVEEGGQRTQSAYTNFSSTVSSPFNSCGTFQIPSAGKHTIRLMYEQAVAGVPTNNIIVSDASAANGQRDVKITARYIDQSMPMPLIRNAVVTSSNFVWGHESFRASSTGVIALESGDWINGNGSCAAVGSNQRCTYTLNPGIFSADPICTVSVLTDPVGSGVQTTCGVQAATTSSVVASCAHQDGTGENPQAITHSIICHGPR